jgi:hypothetical protein
LDHTPLLVVVVQALGTVIHQIQEAGEQVDRAPPEQESTVAVQHYLFKVIQVDQTLEIPEPAEVITALLVVTADFILVQDNIPQEVVVVQDVRAA